MIRYGLLSGYLPIFFTERYTLFSDMYRDCKALGIKDARPLVVNAGVSVVDFDNIIDNRETSTSDEIWSPIDEEEDNIESEPELMQLYQNQYEIVYKAPKENPSGNYFKWRHTVRCIRLSYGNLFTVEGCQTRLCTSGFPSIIV